MRAPADDKVDGRRKRKGDSLKGMRACEETNNNSVIAELGMRGDMKSFAYVEVGIQVESCAFGLLGTLGSGDVE